MDANCYLKDMSGTAIGVATTNPLRVSDYAWATLLYADEKPRVSCTPYGYDVVEGNISGHTTLFKTGYNGDIDATEEDMWAVGGVYAWCSATAAVEVVSDSTADTSSGTGVRTVTIHYLDHNYAEKSATVTLNGTTPATTTETDIFRVNAFRATTTGTSYVAQGNIDVRHISNTPIYSRIATGQTRGRNSIYTVPTGKTLYISQITCSTGHSTGGRYTRFTLRATYDDKSGATTGSIFFPYFEIGVQDGATVINLDFPIKFPARTDIKFSVVSDASNSDAMCTCSYRGWLE